MSVKSYLFTDAERGFFVAQIAHIEALQTELNGALKLVSRREGLEGGWKINEARTGIEKIEEPANA